VKRIVKADRATITELIQKYGRTALEKEIARSSTGIARRGPGAPPFNRGFSACVWANIEVRRDRGADRKKLGVTKARDDLCATLEKRWKRPRPPSGATLSRMYREAEELRAKDSEFRKLADEMLATIKASLTDAGPGAISFPILKLSNDSLPIQIKAGGARAPSLAGYVAINMVLGNKQRTEQKIRT
jgi:hypothetical protein